MSDWELEIRSFLGEVSPSAAMAAPFPPFPSAGTPRNAPLENFLCLETFTFIFLLLLSSLI